MLWTCGRCRCSDILSYARRAWHNRRGYDACNRGLAVLLPRYVRKGRTAGRKDFKKLYTVKIFDAESHVINGMEENRDCDFLGELYMALDLGSHWKGQFFTPYSLCKMTAQLQKNDIEQEIKANGFVSVNDPACGAGALLVAVANTAAEEIKQFNWQNHILFVAQDIDAVTAKMCYIQLSLLGCAGYVKIGDTMANPITANEALYEMTKEDSCYWYTPMYFNDVWNWRRMFHMFDKTMQKNITITNNDEKEKTAQPVENSQDIDRNEFNTEKNGQLSLF